MINYRDYVNIDLAGPITGRDQKPKYILVAFNPCNYLHVFALLKSKKAKEVALALFRHVIIPYGTATFISDRGGEFQNKLMR